jgi:single-strand DNA-binding protein
MANLNKVMLIGRLASDVETVNFQNGGRVAKFRFAVNNRKKNQATGEWVDDPVFIDVEAYNRETGRKLADQVEQYLRKGHQAYLECSLKLDQWEDRDTKQKRSKIKLVLNDMQFLEPRAEGDGGPRPARSAAPARRPDGPPRNGGYDGGYDEPEPMEPPARGADEDIPF